MTERRAILVRERTPEAKAFRRKYGDKGGCRFADKLLRMSRSPLSNTISTVTKDNLLCNEYS